MHLEFFDLEASDYESALRQARSTYGNAVRIHTRKDFTKGTTLSKQKRCRITFYLVDQKPRAVEQESEPAPAFDAEACLQKLLASNDVPPALHASAREQVLLSKAGHTQAEVEVGLLQYLFEGVQFEDEIAARFAVFVGAAGVGKTTTLIKTALYLRARKARKVALLTLDTNRIGSLGQIRQFAREFALPLFEAPSFKALAGLLPELDAYDHVLVDTCAFSAKDEEQKMRQNALLAMIHEQSTFLVVSATSKESDLSAQLQYFSDQRMKAVICTKLDETSGIGNLLGFARKSALPLLFLADGRTIPDDFHIASASYLMTHLKGFSLDLSQFFPAN